MSRLSEMLTVKEAAELKGVLEGTVRRRIERGRLQATKMGGSEKGGGVWLVRRKDLDAWKVRGKSEESTNA